MIEKTVRIQDPSGMHARPAGELVRIAKSFPDCRLSLSSATRTVSASSILSVLSLGLKCGAEVKVSADGASEKEALEAVTEFICGMQ